MLSVDREFLQKFEDGLDPSNPTASEIPLKIVGYGEISAVFQIGNMEHTVFKRLPPFDTATDLQIYAQHLEMYCQALKEASFHLPQYEWIAIENRFGEHILYIAQEKLATRSIGNRIIQHCSPEVLEEMTVNILRLLVQIWRINQRVEVSEKLGIDAQISNWAFIPPPEEDQSGLAGEHFQPIYFDFSTPLLRQNGHDLLNTDIFLKSVPPLVGYFLKKWVLSPILGGYFDPHQVLLDYGANFIPEGQRKRIPQVVAVINAYLEKNAPDLHIKPLSSWDIYNYCLQLILIYPFFLLCRRLYGFYLTRIKKKRYNFILPGKRSEHLHV
jgi:hypothetical protein